MNKRVINVLNAPKLPFSPGIIAGDYLFVSGQAGYYNPETLDQIEGIEAQTKQCLENLKGVLAASNLTLSEVVKVTVYLRKAADFPLMNKVYESYFTGNFPARSTVVTDFVMPGMLIEIECIAYCL